MLIRDDHFYNDINDSDYIVQADTVLFPGARILAEQLEQIISNAPSMMWNGSYCTEFSKDDLITIQKITHTLALMRIAVLLGKER